MDWEALRLSGRLAGATAAILLVLGTPLAYWLAFSRRRAKVLVEALVALPLVLPPTVLGYYVLVTLGPRSPIGRAFENAFGHTLPFTFQGLLVASILYSLPFTVQPLIVAFTTVDRRAVEAAWVLGAGRLRTFFGVIAPLSIPGIVTAAVLSFAHTLGEFGVVLMVGGNIPGRTRTVSISIYDQVQTLDYAAAGRTSVLLVLVSFAVLAATYGFQRRAWATWPAR